MSQWQYPSECTSSMLLSHQQGHAHQYSALSLPNSVAMSIVGFLIPCAAQGLRQFVSEGCCVSGILHRRRQYLEHCPVVHQRKLVSNCRRIQRTCRGGRLHCKSQETYAHPSVSNQQHAIPYSMPRGLPQSTPCLSDFIFPEGRWQARRRGGGGRPDEGSPTGLVCMPGAIARCHTVILLFPQQTLSNRALPYRHFAWEALGWSRCSSGRRLLVETLAQMYVAGLTLRDIELALSVARLSSGGQLVEPLEQEILLSWCAMAMLACESVGAPLPPAAVRTLTSSVCIRACMQTCLLCVAHACMLAKPSSLPSIHGSHHSLLVLLLFHGQGMTELLLLLRPHRQRGGRGGATTAARGGAWSWACSASWRRSSTCTAPALTPAACSCRQVTREAQQAL